MGYTVWETSKEYGPRIGLEGPFTYANGRVLYYDPVEGKYWDPKTDFYVEQDELNLLHCQMFNLIKR
jgi:hypothetical protein